MNKRKFFSFSLLLFLLISSAVPTVVAQESNEGGLSFDFNALYPVTAQYEALPVTLEAEVQFPTSFDPTKAGGVIFGNYHIGDSYLNFEIASNGNPLLRWSDTEGVGHEYRFSSVNVYTGSREHLAVVRDASGKQLLCYWNGVLAQTLEADVNHEIRPTKRFALGGDNASGNPHVFQGRIHSLTLFSDVRTPEEIVSDMTAVGTEDRIAHYDVSSMDANGVISDGKDNQYAIRRQATWISETAPVTNYAYSFAVIGDTQMITYNDPSRLDAVYDWILNHAEDKNIQFVFGLGDITEANGSVEWLTAYKNISKLDGVIPYSVVRGNHDAVLPFAYAFPHSEYAQTVGGTFDGTMLNTWQLLNVGEIDYLMMTLDYGASDEVLAWANQVVEKHPQHNVIISTHSYLYNDGTTLDAEDLCPPSATGGYNDGDDMWNKLIRKHENIVLVLSGHDATDHIVTAQSVGDHGNTVTQMLIDPQDIDAAQGATGMVAMLYFSEDGRQMAVEYYSTVKDMYFLETNQFCLTLDLIEDQIESIPTQAEELTEEPEPEPEPEPEAIPTSKVVLWILGIAVIVELSVIAVMAQKQRRKKSS